MNLLLPAGLAHHLDEPVGKTKVVAVANQKGGVGKSTLAMQLAAVYYEAQSEPIADQLARELGDPVSEVCVVNVDPQASTKWWEMRAQQRRDGLPFEQITVSDPADLRHIKEDGRRRLILVDTPGNLENEQTVRAVLEQSDEVLVPMITEPLCFDPTARTIEVVVAAFDMPWRVVINNWQPRDGIWRRDRAIKYAHNRGWGDKLCETVVRQYTIHADAAADGILVTDYPREGTALKARQDIYDLAAELAYLPSMRAA
jgi:chromosome partitioning protein